MKRLLALLMLGACATTPTATPLERVAGCWINRTNFDATTMRWLPDRARPGAYIGDRLHYRANGPARKRYSLEPSAEGYALCEIDSANTATQCWQVAQGEGGSLEGGRAFIDAYGDRLRITVVGDGADRTIFQGRRDGCD